VLAILFDTMLCHGGMSFPCCVYHWHGSYLCGCLVQDGIMPDQLLDSYRIMRSFLPSRLVHAPLLSQQTMHTFRAHLQAPRTLPMRIINPLILCVMGTFSRHLHRQPHQCAGTDTAGRPGHCGLCESTRLLR